MANYSWNVGSPFAGAWTTASNWDLNSSYPRLVTDTATLSKPLSANTSVTLTNNTAISPLSVTFANTGGGAFPWLLGNGSTNSSWTLDADSTINITTRTNGQVYDLGTYIPVYSTTHTLTKTGAGAWAQFVAGSTARFVIQDGPFIVLGGTTNEIYVGHPTTAATSPLGISGASVTTNTNSNNPITFYRDANTGWSTSYFQLIANGVVKIAQGTGAASPRILTGGTSRAFTIAGGLAGSVDVTFTGPTASMIVISGASSASDPYTGTMRQTGGVAVVSVTSTGALRDGIYDTASSPAISFPANSVIGGLTGSANVAFATAGVTFGGANVDVSSTWSGNFTSNVTLTKSAPVGGTSVLTLSGNGSTRGTANTAISRGAIQLNANLALYASSATGITTVSSGAGLWLSGGITTPASAPIRINGQGVLLNGAIRNVAGNNTVGSTVTAESPATIQNDVSGTTLTLKSLALNSTTTKLAAGSGATIRMEGAVTGSSTSKLEIPSTNAGTVQAGTVSLFSSLGSTATVQIDGIFDLNGNSQTVSGTLDGIGSMVGAGTVTMSTGSTLKAGSGAGGGTLSMGALSFGASSQSMSLIKNAGDLSKVAVTNAVTNAAGGTTTVNATSTTGWTNGTPYTFLTYGSRSGTGTFAAGTLTGGTGRQAMQTPVVGATSATFSVAEGAASVTWNGGISGGQWYDTQATGWTGSGPSGSVTDFRNGDTVTFDATSTAAATLTSNVNVVSLTMNGAAHTVGASGAYTLTNAGALSVSGAFKQTLNVAGEHGAVGIAAGSTLELGHPNALGSGTSAITLTGTSAKLAFNSGANGLATNRTLTLSPTTATTQFLETSGNAIVTLAAVSGGLSTSWLSKIGAGLVSFSGSGATTSVFRIGVSGTSETAGANVVRFGGAYPLRAIRLNSASILEISASTFTKTYGTADGQFYLEDTVGAGAGFSAYNASGVDVSTAINFGTTTGTQWNGPMFFGTALGTATGRLTMSGALSMVAGFDAQVFHVFDGATAGAASSARINNLRNLNTSNTQTFFKYGPGSLYVVNGTQSSGGSAAMRVVRGTFEVGPTTTNIIASIKIEADSVSPVIRHEASTGATICPAFQTTPQADFTLEAASSTGDFTISTLNIGNNTVTLSGSGVGAKATDSGNGTGKYVKTGTGTWSLNYPYASKAAGFSGGIDATQGTIRTTEKFGFGGGPIAITAGASVQFASTDPLNMGSIASLTTTGSTARLIIGA